MTYKQLEKRIEEILSILGSFNVGEITKKGLKEELIILCEKYAHSEKVRLWKQLSGEVVRKKDKHFRGLFYIALMFVMLIVGTFLYKGTDLWLPIVLGFYYLIIK